MPTNFFEGLIKELTNSCQDLMTFSTLSNNSYHNNFFSNYYNSTILFCDIVL